ncbi:MAG: ankyrin repeat domain-containing protein [Legionellaceae bacterium]
MFTKTLFESDPLTVVHETPWRPLGKGAYHQTYLSQKKLLMGGYSGQWVLKSPFKTGSEYNEVDRALRKWKLLNPDYPVFKTHNGWLLPFLGRDHASDEQIAQLLLELYQRTGSIVADACGKANVLFYHNKVICIDMDLALRKNSIISEDFLKEVYPERHFKQYLVDYANSKPLSVSRTRTLLYLETALPLYEKRAAITPRVLSLIRLFRITNTPLTQALMDLLLSIADADPKHEIHDRWMTIDAIHALASIDKPTPLTKTFLLKWIDEQLRDPAHIRDLIQKGNLDDVRVSFKQSKSHLHDLDQNNLSLFDWAVACGHETIATYLLHEGVQVTPTKQGSFHAIHAVAEHGHLNLLKRLHTIDPSMIHVVDHYNQTTLLIAASQGHTSCVDFLSYLGVPVNEPTRLPPEHVDHDQHHLYTPLDWAIDGGHVQTVALLLKRGAVAYHTPTHIKKQSIHALCATGDLKKIKLLIERNPHVLNTKDNLGKTPLEQSVEGGFENVSLFLLNQGATIPQLIEGKTHIFHLAIQEDHILLVERLLKEEPKLIHLADKDYLSPIALAAYYNRSQMLRLLLSQGADINRPTQLPAHHKHYERFRHYLPLDYAIISPYSELVSLLLKAGAKTHTVHSKMNQKTINDLIREGNLTAIQSLIQINKSLLNTCDPEGYTPLEIAVKQGEEEIALYFIKERALMPEQGERKSRLIQLALVNELSGIIEFLNPTPAVLTRTLNKKRSQTLLFEKSHLKHPLEASQQQEMVEDGLSEDHIPDRRSMITLGERDSFFFRSSAIKKKCAFIGEIELKILS